MLRRIVPGVALLLTVGVTARALSAAIPVDHLILTIFLSLVLGTVYGVPVWAQDGVATHKVWLEAGIVVMGASVALDRVVAAGPVLVVLVIGTVTTTALVVELHARYVFAVHEKTGSLLAAGSSICGVSAVVAIAEGIDVDESRIAYAAATVLLFDAAMVFVYPLIGHALGLSSTVFGVWTGLTMFSTGPVTAAGFAFSETAGEWSVLVKLTRNATIGVAAIAYAVYYARRGSTVGDSETRESAAVGDGASRGLGYLWETFPKFIFGFLVTMLAANSGLLDAGQVASLANASDWAFLLAFAGLGLEVDVGELRAVGYRPVLAVLVALVTVASTTLLIVQTVF
ncbi:putative sulfate exporter family transporter [Haloarculaceae archaeon H-GB11]|nr:putative sulfate exporter family transporter [Haloarculaceae archaeon H-GB11]